MVTEPEERQASSFMQQIATNFKNRLTKRKVKAAEKRQVCHAKLHIMVVLPNMASSLIWT